jgi:hypothetical protein
MLCSAMAAVCNLLMVLFSSYFTDNCSDFVPFLRLETC